ncbi:stage III sporulation protein AH [Virgibacillus dakarensis]|uniref:Stage III sporulation protein AH n=1 Tax=Lentibacillus populi TaxID=1827502 RepID=A0A9W5X5V2_9BACI|nr:MULTISPECIES: stage III sporulation protein AH [Bacillaceae]MBT2216391.1 stage III sporulation protein AH [Virgibacillus dakarensis]MTW86581.1 stage III sporulation protein AH [Virgibacillus dakarensis]GGB47146.1 hypothetical protein GCM10011409_25800 [Lentibacillus populi]
MIINFLEDVKNESYEKLIDLAFSASDMFILVVRKDMGSTKEFDHVLEELSSSLIKRKKQKEWPSTKLLGWGKWAYVYYYRTDDHAKQVIKKVSKSLYSWEQHNLPEDLSFFIEGKPWLVNIAHESEAYIDTDDRYLLGEIKNIDGIAFEIEE